MFPEATTLKRSYTFSKDLDEPEENHYNPYWQSQTQDRVRITNAYDNFNSLTELPVNKKRKIENGIAEYTHTPKRMLVFNKEEHSKEQDKENEDYHSHFAKEKLFNFVTPFAQSEKKKIDKFEDTSDYVYSPGKAFESGKREKRNIKPFSHYNRDEYELDK